MKIELHCADFQFNLMSKRSKFRSQLSHAFTLKIVQLNAQTQLDAVLN